MFNLNSPLRTLRLVSLMGKTQASLPSSVVLEYGSAILTRIFGSHLQSDRRKGNCETNFLRLYRPSGDILDHGIADSDSICRTYMQRTDFENITLRNSPESILFCS